MMIEHVTAIVHFAAGLTYSSVTNSREVQIIGEEHLLCPSFLRFCSSTYY